MGGLVWGATTVVVRCSRLGTFSFLAPLFGVALGVVLLDGQIETAFLLGALPVLVGIVLVSGHGWVARVRAGLARRWVTATATLDSGAG